MASQENGNFQGEARFKLLFKSGGAIDFGQAMLRAANMAKRNANNAAPPPYSPPTGSWYQAPPPAYTPSPQGYYGWMPPTQAFPSGPPPNSVFMTDNPPPYPGMAPQGFGGPTMGNGYPNAPMGYPGAYPNDPTGYPNAPAGGYPGSPSQMGGGYPGAPPPQMGGYGNNPGQPYTPSYPGASGGYNGQAGYPPQQPGYSGVPSAGAMGFQTQPSELFIWFLCFLYFYC